MLNNLKNCWKSARQLSLRVYSIAWIFDWLFSFKSKEQINFYFFDKIGQKSSTWDGNEKSF